MSERLMPNYGHEWVGRYFHEKYCTNCGITFYNWCKRRLVPVCPGLRPPGSTTGGSG